MVGDATRLRFSELCAALPVQFIEPVRVTLPSMTMDFECAMRTLRSIQIGHSCLGQRTNATLPLARRRSIGDQPDLDAPLFCPNQCFDDARSRREAVGGDEDLCLGAIDGVYCKGGAVFLGREAHRNCGPGSQRRNGYSK
jgi:hypothetical protein